MNKGWFFCYSKLRCSFFKTRINRHFLIPVNGIIEKNKYIFAFLSDTNNNRSVRYQVKERWLLE